LDRDKSSFSFVSGIIGWNRVSFMSNKGRVPLHFCFENDKTNRRMSNDESRTAEVEPAPVQHFEIQHTAVRYFAVQKANLSFQSGDLQNFMRRRARPGA